MQQRYANAWYRLFYVKLTTLVCARIQEFTGFHEPPYMHESSDNPLKFYVSEKWTTRVTTHRTRLVVKGKPQRRNLKRERTLRLVRISKVVSVGGVGRPFCSRPSFGKVSVGRVTDVM